MRTREIFLIAVLCIFILKDTNAQNGSYFLLFMGNNNNKKHISYEIQEGTIRLRNSQIIIGRFKYDHWEFPVKNFIFYRDAEAKNKAKIKFKDIKQVVFIGSDTNTVERTDSTAFVSIEGKLLRILTEGKINLYDKLITVKEATGKLGETIFIKEGTRLRRIATTRKLNKWYQGLATQYPNLRIRNEYLNRIEIIKEIQKYNALSN